MKRKTFLIPIYRTKVTLFKDKTGLEKASGHKIADDAAGTVVGSFVWIDDGEADYETVSHEAYHLTRRVLEHVGVDHSADEEVVAYLMGYLCDKLCKFYLEDK